MTPPDFADLFPVCRCNRNTCDHCTGLQLTPRTACALHAAADHLEELAHLDVRNNNSAPVTEHGEWHLFDRYPRFTWKQDAHWRRQAARAYTDLRRDLTTGNRPEPRCAAEEIALHLIVDEVNEALQEGRIVMFDPEMALLPAHHDDLHESVLEEDLFQDTDILMLFTPPLDGIEQPEGAEQLRLGDYRPQAWFTLFESMPSRSAA